MTSNQIRYFIEVAERLNMTAAAERLYLAQSTLSRQIALLEEEFGTRFFVRDKSGLRLTHAGEVFYEEIRAIYAHEQNLRAKIEMAVHGEPQTLQIAVMEETIPPEPFVRAVRRLRNERPGITITVRPFDIHSIYMGLDSGLIDVVYTLRNNVEMVPNAAVIPIKSERMCLAAGERVTLLDTDAISEAQIGALSEREELYMIEPNIFGDQLAPRLRSQLNGELVARTRYLQSDGQITTHVLCDLGVAMVHESHRLSETPGIRMIPVMDATPVELVVAYRAQNDNPALEVFLTLLHEELEKERTNGTVN